MSEKTEEGWGLPSQSKKWHYFVGSMSLCGRWGFFFGKLEQGKDNSPDNCTVCIKRFKKRKEKEKENVK